MTVIFFKVILRKRQSLHLIQLQISRHFTKMEKHHHPTCPFGLVSVNPDVTHTHYLSSVCPNTQWFTCVVLFGITTTTNI